MPAALAAIPAELVIAAAILLLLWAYYSFWREPLAQLFSRVPAIGPPIVNALDDAARAVGSWAAGIAKTTTDAVVQAVWVPVAQAVNFINGLVATFWSLYDLIQRIARMAAGELGDLADRVAALVNLVANVRSLVASAMAWVDRLRDAVARIVAVDIPAAVGQVEAWARSFVAAAIAAAVRPIDAALAALRSLIADVAGRLERALAAGLDSVRAWAAAAIAAAVAVVHAEVVAVEHTLVGAITDVQGRLGQLVTALAPILALDLVRVVPQVITEVERLDRECITPTCNALTPRLPLLNLLAEGTMAVAMLEVVRAAIDDPTGAANDTAAAVGGLRTLTDDLIGPLLGIRV